MEVPRLGFKVEQQMQAYATAMATLDPNSICDLSHSLQQCRILYPLSEARDQTHILISTSQVLNPLSHNVNSRFYDFKVFAHMLYLLLGIYLFLDF